MKQTEAKPTFLETLKKNLARLALKLPLPLIKLLNGKPIQIDGQTMDVVVQFMVKYFTEQGDHIINVAGRIPIGRKAFAEAVTAIKNNI